MCGLSGSSSAKAVKERMDFKIHEAKVVKRKVNALRYSSSSLFFIRLP